jgi:hypothetical protein
MHGNASIHSCEGRQKDSAGLLFQLAGFKFPLFLLGAHVFPGGLVAIARNS